VVLKGRLGKDTDSVQGVLGPSLTQNAAKNQHQRQQQQQLYDSIPLLVSPPIAGIDNKTGINHAFLFLHYESWVETTLLVLPLQEPLRTHTYIFFFKWQ
jgi:hypothetical protein